MLRPYYRLRAAFVELQPFLVGLAITALAVTLTVVVLSLQEQRDTLRGIVAAQRAEAASREARAKTSLEAAKQLLVDANETHDETAKAEHQQLVSDISKLLARPEQVAVPVPGPVVTVPVPKTTTSIRRETQSAVPVATTTTTTVCEKGKCKGRGH